MLTRYVHSSGYGEQGRVYDDRDAQVDTDV